MWNFPHFTLVIDNNPHSTLNCLTFSVLFISHNNFSYTLMRAMLGDFDFPGFVTAHKTIGPFFFIFYIFIVFFILLNMFLAIINDTYSEVKGEMEATKIQFEITDLFARGYNNVKGQSCQLFVNEEQTKNITLIFYKQSLTILLHRANTYVH